MNALLLSSMLGLLALLASVSALQSREQDKYSIAENDTDDVARPKRSLFKHLKSIHLVKKLKALHWLKKFKRFGRYEYSAIYPGTKWCGAGNKARDFYDVGWKWRTDVCCRGHDLCARAIEAGEEKYGIKNHGAAAISHCDCDKEFYQCLKQSDCLDSDIVGVTYFDVFNNYCIYQDYPQKCSKFLFLKLKCVPLTSERKVWQKKRIELSYLGGH